MKIYFDGIIYSWQTGGGIYRYFEELIKRCGENRDTEVVLLEHTPSYGISIKKGVNIKNVTGITTVPGFGFNFIRKVFYPINRILIENLFKKTTAGVFHSTYYTTYRNLKIPQILTVHDMTYEKFPNFFNSRGAKRFIANKKKCIMSADVIICVSNATKNTLIDMYNIDAKKISIIHHGLSGGFISESNVEEVSIGDKPYFLFVGYRSSYKNFNFFIESFSMWNKNKVYNVLLVGGGEISKEETLLFKKLGVEKQVRHLGFVKDRSLGYIYKNAEAFVFPSLDEGFGIPILEAISSKTQVLASNIEAFKEIGEDMLIYFEQTNKESLIKAFNKSISGEVSEEELIRRSKYVIEKYTWDKCADKTMEIYHKALYEK